MRCFYCGNERPSGSPEHIVPAHLGGRLTTRAVCGDCNHRAGEEIDDPLATFLMVQIPKALNDVRNIRRLSRTPQVVADAIDPAGQDVTLKFSPSGREVVDQNGNRVADAEWAEITYPFDSDLWVRLIAKISLGCASKLVDENWLDEPLARALRSVLWHGPIDPAIWPPPEGVPGWPDELVPDHAVRHALGPDRHLVSIMSHDGNPGSSITHLFLFGGQIVCRLPLPGFEVEGSGPAWVLDWRPAPPPQQEDFDAAIERLLREQGWDEQRIDAARLP